VQEVVNARQDAARAKALHLSLSVAEPQLVRASPGIAASVVSNLVGNAIHHTQHGGVEVRLERGRLTVLDTGSGIPAEDLSRVFERRYRGTHSSGHGLGLYIVKRICDQLGWTVRSSAPQQGTLRGGDVLSGELTLFLRPPNGFQRAAVHVPGVRRSAHAVPAAGGVGVETSKRGRQRGRRKASAGRAGAGSADDGLLA
jgi:signal transduction histidine kinase